MDKKNNSILIALCSLILLALLGGAIWLFIAKPLPLAARIAIVVALFFANPDFARQSCAEDQRASRKKFS